MSSSPQEEHQQRPTQSEMSNGMTNERQVTDPVTHLPITIHDSTSIKVEQIPPPYSDSKANEGLEKKDVNERRHAEVEQVVREETSKGWWEDESSDRARTAIIVAMSISIGGCTTLVLSKILGRIFGGQSSEGGIFDLIVGSVACTLLAMVAAFVILNHNQDTTDRKRSKKPWTKPSAQQKPESVIWLNSFLDTLWPIVNPALFTTVSDMLEDALQASLPKMIHAVRVADIGQGSEPLRILSIRWLDTSSASEERDGMVAEEGDFVNFEAAVAYRARSSSSSLKGKSANLHLLVQFWLTGGIVFPVWVEITGIVATARVRIHLTPNPPFLSLMTLTILGQPKVSLSVTPLAKTFPNAMNVPGLSDWILKTVNGVIAEYVAPRSLSLDLKSVLVGREKMDTEAHGVVWINIKSAEGFKNGDGIEIWKNNDGRKGDVYVTVSWGKWGKPLWSTRIIQNGAHPIWEESTALLVAPAELNSQENVKLQLWDSDRFTADDNLGTIELPLFDIMNPTETRNRIGHRTDRFLADDSKSKWPGSLTWSVGYFSKTTLEQHLANKEDVDVEELKENIEQEAKAKLREAETRKQGEKKGEIEQQKREDLREKTEEIIAGTPPAIHWPVGILSVCIEQIAGLALDHPRQSGANTMNNEEVMEAEESDDLPSPYCTVIINHTKAYKTRTKMKTSNAYFNAETELFIKSWPTSVVMIAVRDARMHEIDPLIGVVVLPLRHLFSKYGRSQVSDSFPLVGGMGYGRMKCSLVFRSVQIQPSSEQIPRTLLGWDVGTLEIHTETIRASTDLPEDLKSARIRFRTLYGRDKALPRDDGWRQKKNRPIRLAVTKRFASCLLIQFRKSVLGPDKTPAFGTLWLKDLPDVEEVVVRLSVRRNEGKAMVQGRFNTSEEIGEKVGELEMRVRFWPGLSGYHHSLADSDLAMADVMEVLDAAEKSKEISTEMLYEGDLDSDDEFTEESSSSSSSGSSDSESGESGEEGRNRLTNVKTAAKDYQNRRSELHRKHRGLMQWSAARKVAWIGRGTETQAKKIKQKVEGKLKHRQRDGGVEKEA